MSEIKFQRIFLVGYMGVGKTTIGRLLAKEMDLEFIDLDKVIESKYYKTISELFAEKGEEEFRKIEQCYLREVSQFENVVISTGGGTPCFFDNMDLMNRMGKTIYIKASVEELALRIKRSKNIRPILKNQSPENLENFIENHLDERIEFYQKASIIVDTQKISGKNKIHQIVNYIYKIVNE